MSAYIVTRDGKTGRRFIVRYRRGGRGFKAEHAGSFRTLKEARTRRDLVAGELAAGRDPRLVLVVARERPPVLLFREVAERWRAGRVDVAESTRELMAVRNLRFNKVFGDWDPAQITVEQITDWVASETDELAASTVNGNFVQLRAILDYAVGRDLNPARDEQVRLPRVRRETPEPPSEAQVAAIEQAIHKRYKLVIRLLEQTGCRIGELVALDWSDVDVAGGRFRVQAGKTAAARRWVACPGWLIDRLVGDVPYDDRAGRVFPGFRPTLVRAAMGRACKTAGLPHFHPHDLRHRYISVQLARGVPVANVAAQVGHARQSITWDTYSHVLLSPDGD